MLIVVLTMKFPDTSALDFLYLNAHNSGDFTTKSGYVGGQHHN